MTWAIITFLLLLWIFGFSAEARANRKRKASHTDGPSAYSTYMSRFFSFRIRLRQKRDSDVIQFLNDKYLPNRFVAALVFENLCGDPPYNENEDIRKYFPEYLENDPRTNRVLKSIELSFIKERCPEVVKILEPLNRRDRKRFVLSLIRDAMQKPVYS